MDAATIWLIIGIAGFVLAAVFLVISVVLFVRRKIPMIIGDLSGKTRARAIAQLREENEKSGAKLHRSSTYNINRGPLTAPVDSEPTAKKESERPAFIVAHPSKRLDTGEIASTKATDVLTPGTSVLPQSKETAVLQPGTTVLDNPDGSKPTAVLETQNVEATAVLNQGEKTTALADSGETAVLNQGEKTTALADSGETAVLNQGEKTTVLADSGETAVLNQGEKTTVLADSGETAVLNQGEKTTVLTDSGATEVLDTKREPTVSLPSAKKADLLFASAADAAAVSQPAAAPTTVLDDSVAASAAPQKAIRFKIIKDIKIIHADEIIM